MNILFLLKTLDLGGVEVVSATLAKQFSHMGHQVIIFAFDKGNGTAINSFDKLHVNIGHGYTYNKKNINQLRTILEKQRIQIVINQWGLPFLPMKILKHASKGVDVKIISIHHNDPLSNGHLKDIEISLSNTRFFLKRILLKAKWHIVDYITSQSMRYVYKHSDRYMVLSSSFINHFKLFTRIANPKKLLVQTNPVTIDASGYVFEPENKEKEILYVGRIDYNQKRVCRVIDTWALLENKYPEWRLTIVGDGPERANVEKQVDELGLKRVSFEGFQTPDNYYKRASILLLTSEYEGFGLVLVECMSFGVVPIVYGSYSAVYDIIDDGKDGIILPFNDKGFDAAKMAKRIADIINSPKQLQTMAVKAMGKSKNYSINNIYRSWITILEGLIKK